MRILDHLTCLPKNLYIGQEAIFKTEHETIDWFQIGKEYVKVVYCHLAFLTHMHIMRNTRLDEAQAGIKNAGRNINNLGMHMTQPL